MKCGLETVVALASSSAIAAGSMAHAASPLAFPGWVSAPAEAHDSYPYNRTLNLTPRPSGAAVVKCHRHENGDLDHCQVISETPDNLGFGRAAAVAASLSRAVSPPADALTSDDDVQVAVAFDGQAATAHDPKLGEHTVVEPNWSVRPNFIDIMRYYPEMAQRRNIGGQAMVACYVPVEGPLDGCRVVSEAPEGLGFGEAALAAARTFSMRPKTIDGQPVPGGVVVIPINFSTPTSGAGPKAYGDKFLSAPVWATQADSAQIAAAFPQSQIGTTAKIYVVLVCMVGADGGLDHCKTENGSDLDPSFDAAARGLTKYYRVDRTAYGAGSPAGFWAEVVVPFTPPPSR